MRRRAVLLLLLGAAGLALYLWPALAAPVVEWSDSAVDLDWARRGLGIWRPAGMVDHPAKPGYLLFLRAALGLSGGTVRGIVLLQSILLWGSIGWSAIRLARRKSPALGVALYVVLILFLRMRDASSAIMTEALSAILFLPVAVLLLEPPRGDPALVLFGLLEGGLFLVRPNLGAAALLLSAIRLLFLRRWRGLLFSLAAAAALVLPFWIATSPRRPQEESRGIAFQMFEASADDYWTPSIGPVPARGNPAEISRELTRRATANWRRTLSAGGPDLSRQLSWRALHGLLGTEFYDSRWSTAYRRLTTASRLLSPFAILVAIALLAALPWSRGDLPLKGLGLVLVLGMIGQDLLLGSNPRYVLPVVPGLLLFGVCAAPSVFRRGARGPLWALLFTALLVAIIASRRSVLSWEWGLVESSGVTIEQPIRRGSLPPTSPATLHIRIAAPLLPTTAGIEVVGPGGARLYSSAQDPSRQRPEISIGLPREFLEENRVRSVTLRLTAVGSYDAVHYLLFPVIPPPWAAPARREGSAELSPASGVARGALDWWAHAGRDEQR